MKIMFLLAGSALLLTADAATAQSQPASPPTQANMPVSCPMAGNGMGTGMTGTGMMGQGGMGNMQQMQAMRSQMHGDMQAMQTQMTAMSTEMQAMHQEMMKMREGMPKHH